MNLESILVFTCSSPSIRDITACERLIIKHNLLVLNPLRSVIISQWSLNVEISIMVKNIILEWNLVNRLVNSYLLLHLLLLKMQNSLNFFSLLIEFN